MAAEEPQDQSSWWESLGPILDSPLPASAVDEPVQWPEPVDWGDGGAPLNEIARSARLYPGPIGPSPDDDWPSWLWAGTEPVEPAVRPDANRPPDGHRRTPAGPQLLATGAMPVPAFYAEHAPPASPRGWRERFAGRASDMILVGVLAGVAAVLLGILLLAPTGRGKPQPAPVVAGAGEIAATGNIERLPVTTTTSPPTPTSVATSVAPPAAPGPPDPAADAAVMSPPTPSAPATGATTATTHPASHSPTTAEPPVPTPEPTLTAQPPAVPPDVATTTTTPPRPPTAPTPPIPARTWSTITRPTLPDGFGF